MRSSVGVCRDYWLDNNVRDAAIDQPLWPLFGRVGRGFTMTSGRFSVTTSIGPGLVSSGRNLQLGSSTLSVMQLSSTWRGCPSHGRLDGCHSADEILEGLRTWGSTILCSSCWAEEPFIRTNSGPGMKKHKLLRVAYSEFWMSIPKTGSS